MFSYNFYEALCQNSQPKPEPALEPGEDPTVTAAILRAMETYERLFPGPKDPNLGADTPK